MTKKHLPLDELSGAIGRILGLLLTEEKVDQAVQSLSLAIKESVPGTLGAGVSILDSQARRTSTGFTDNIVEQADFLQYDLGQGPCLTAWASEESVLIEDLGTDTRWPEWRTAVSSLPIRSVVSAPLIANGRSIGAIKIYAPEPAVFDAGTVTLMELFASPAATLLSHIQSTETPQRISEGLQARPAQSRSGQPGLRDIDGTPQDHSRTGTAATDRERPRPKQNPAGSQRRACSRDSGRPQLRPPDMGFERKEPEQRRRLLEALSAARISTGTLWLQYFSIGGSVGEYEVEAYLQGMLSVPELERDLLAMAANELLNNQPGPHAPYADELPNSDSNGSEPGSDPAPGTGSGMDAPGDEADPH
ncbi:hypothetical protein StoSoilB13_41510 (plasmid) [Arthrobacter sp. StoSoilB13]|nr:hypothetical protein StoSoilB13_41510 [Arthrobacter sp. StoSoilB13]